MLAIGLMSGTSMDAIDAALCRFVDGRWHSLLATHTHPYPDELRARLLRIQADPEAPLSLHGWVALDEAVARCFADAALGLLRRSAVDAEQVRVVGAHGQTVFHDPRGIGSSLQIGSPARIAVRTQIATVADFRRVDIALGGEGAPLVPAFHHALLARADEVRAVLNLGGIANLTTLPGLDVSTVSGFDTGPANALMDEWHALHRQQAYDNEGAWAGTGSVHADLLHALILDPYFDAAPPKSTGRDRFNLRWARQRYPALDALPAADVQRTFCELTALTIGSALRRHAPQTQRLLVCGGGIHNATLMEALAAAISPVSVDSTDAHGIDARWMEAAAFAWLAVQRLLERPGNLPSVTGAQRAAVLGALYAP